MASFLAFRVAVRYAAKMDPAKVQEAMIKVRKNAIGSINPSQIAAIFEVLGGWKMEKAVGLVKLYGRGSDENHPETFWSDEEAEAKSRHDSVKGDAVTSLPSKPKAGKLYVLDLTDVGPGHRNDFRFSMKPWMGSEGWKITTPAGREQEFYPSLYYFGDFYHGYKPAKLKNVAVSDIIKWLNAETDWLDQIDKFLGMQSYEAEKAEKGIIRTRENTGSCPVCFMNVKMKNTKMVIHGYERPGYGYIVGNCFGVNYPPFELSDDGSKNFLEKYLKPALEHTNEYVKRLKDGKVTDLASDPSGRKIVRPGDPDWERVLKSTIEDNESRAKSLEKQIVAFKKLIANWKERPLPKEGEPHIDWYNQGQIG